MRAAKSVGSILALLILLFSFQVNLSSCQKEIITDTLYITDTLTLKDTIRIVDSSNCNCYNLNDGLVAYYNFNNGTLKDSSGYDNHITFSNAVKTADRFGRANNAYLFNGSSSYMSVPNSVSLNPTKAITLMATFKIQGFYAANCSNNQIFGKGWNDYIDGFYALRFYSTPGCNMPLDTSKEVIYGSFGDLSARPSTATSTYVHTNKWYNVVFTYGDGQASLYIDGVLQKSVAESAWFTPNSQELFIGKHGDPQYPFYFNGIIDELRIYNKALCAAAVKQLYDANH
ncbi:MAG: LamG domain-containing protein [Chitinophagaceae bacterium]